MRSRWDRMGLYSNTTGILTMRGERHRREQPREAAVTGGRPCGNKGRGWRGAPTDQGIPRIDGKELGSGKAQILPQSLEKGTYRASTLVLDFQPPNSETIHFCGFLNHLVTVFFYGSLSKLIQSTAPAPVFVNVSHLVLARYL